MADQIHIQGLRLRTRIGISPEERHDWQEILIHLTLDTDLRAAGRSDSLNDTLDYRDLTRRLMALGESSRFSLIEKLATEIAALCLEEPRVEGVRVTVEKPRALRFARSVGVTLERRRTEA